MKYNELERRLKKEGCYEADEEINGHPAWYSPKTDCYFQMSHHGAQEVKVGTLKAICKAAGITTVSTKKTRKDKAKTDNDDNEEELVEGRD